MSAEESAPGQAPVKITCRTSSQGASHVRRIRPTRVGFDAPGAEPRRVLLAAVRSADGTPSARKAGPVAPVLGHVPAQSVRIG